MSFNPWVTMNAPDRATPSPSHPVLASQAFRQKLCERGVPLAAVGPGTKMRQMIPMIAAGPRIETVIRTVSEIVSFSEYGREIEASSRENACRLPWTFHKPPPTAKVALYGKRQQMKDRHGLGDDLQNNNPINNI
jgi:hypothetical protein